MENKIEAVVRENVDTALEQADEFLKQASAATGEEAKELQAKAKECLARASRNMKSFYDKTSEEAEKLPVKLTTASAPILGALSVSQLSAASCSVSWLLASNSSRAFGDKYVR